MVKVLGLLGSARKDGNSELLLDSILNGTTQEGAENETIKLAKVNVKPCLNCGRCDKTGKCVQKDDMQVFYDKLLTYDIIILASPIYFMGVSAWSKAFIDRCQALWVRKFKLGILPDAPREKRRGIFVSVAGMGKPNTFDGAKLTVKSFFATIHVTYQDNLLYNKIDNKGEIANHPTALQEAFEMGRKIAGELRT